ncbi:MAG: peptidoglycan D,D-transpeptidase FtsI family protein, partial [Gammaproteobacteria bacterium]
LSALQMPGVKLIEEHKRYYPVGEIVAPVIGLAGIDGQGQEGIEVLFDRYLTSGATKVRKRSRAGQIPIPQRLTEPDMFAVAHGTDGTARQGRFARKSLRTSGAQDVHLTLDIDAQYLAYRTLKKAVVASGAQAGTLVAVDVVTGEVLAMVSYPSYNPNDRRELQVQRNRVAMDQIEPGSVLKPFTVAAALESGSWSQGKSVDTNPGYIKLSKGVHFADTENHGVMSLSEVLTRSSQVAAAKLALSMHPQPYMRLLKSWGFGRQTGIGLPAEAEGNLPTAFGLSKVDQAAVGFGYGCTVTALQLAQAYSVLGNEGMLVPLRLVKGMSMQASQRVMSRKVARSVLSMLEQAVQHGTGRRARIDGYRVAGKTGTVHLTGRDGYEQDRYRALFAGLVPVSRPRIAMVVTIEEPNPNRYFGGVVAAPVFATVARQLLMRLRVVPDMTYASAG